MVQLKFPYFFGKAMIRIGLSTLQSSTRNELCNIPNDVCALECFNFSIQREHIQSDIPGYLRNTSNQTLFLSEALRFCTLTFSESEDILHFVIHPSGRIFLLIYNNRMLSAKLGCIGQAVSGKLRVTLTQQYLR